MSMVSPDYCPRTIPDYVSPDYAGVDHGTVADGWVAEFVVTPILKGIEASSGDLR